MKTLILILFLSSNLFSDILIDKNNFNIFNEAMFSNLLYNGFQDVNITLKCSKGGLLENNVLVAPLIQHQDLYRTGFFVLMGIYRLFFDFENTLFGKFKNDNAWISLTGIIMNVIEIQAIQSWKHDTDVNWKLIVPVMIW